MKRQNLKVMRSILSWSYTYGLGLMPKWSDTQYMEAQRLLNKAMRLILGASNRDENSLSQQKMCKLLDWAPIHITHKVLALGTLNRILKNKNR